MDDWTLLGNCGTEEADVFFPKSEKLKNSELEYPLSLCRGCRVREDCLEDALQMEATLGTGKLYGIRGGKLPHERKDLLRRRGLLTPLPRGKMRR